MSLPNRVARTRQPRSPDRREQILTAATRLFGERGYHEVTLQEIGDEVGLDASSLYFHFPGKEAILLAVVRRMIDEFAHAAAAPAALVGSSPEDQLAAMVQDAMGSLVLQRRYLLGSVLAGAVPAELLRELNDTYRKGTQLPIQALMTLHPELTRREAGVIADAVSCIGVSLTYYRPRIARPALIDRLSRMAMAGNFAAPAIGERRAFDIALERRSVPEAGGSTSRRRGTRRAVEGQAGYDRVQSSSRERLLAEAVALFRAIGFTGVGIDDIARSYGITGGGVYRHFESKEEMLSAAVTRASDLLAMAAGRVFGRAADALEALTALTDTYLDLVLDDPDLLAVYWMQANALPKDRGTLITRERRAYIKDWAGVLADLRPELSEGEAQAMAYAAIAMLNSVWYLGQDRLDPPELRSILRSVVLNSLLNS